MSLADDLIQIRREIQQLRIDQIRIIDVLLPSYRDRLNEQTQAITALQQTLLKHIKDAHAQ